MRLSLTAVDAGTGARADVLLDADADTPVECVARALYGMLRRDAPAPPSAIRSNAWRWAPYSAKSATGLV